MFRKSIRIIDEKKIELLLVSLLFLFFVSCIGNKDSQKNSSNSKQLKAVSSSVISHPEGEFRAYKTKSKITVDGFGKDSLWGSLDWYGMNYVWLGEAVDSTDYYGKFKLAWDNQYLYILVEVVDEHINPTLKNGVENYWKGDYVEVFIDEDNSGGDHQYNHQAFAYHVSTEGHAIDKSLTKETIFFDDHVDVKRSQIGNKHLWEMAIQLFDNTFDETSNSNTPIEILNQKRIGFSIAYGDNDGNNSRENFIGSKKTHGIDNNQGYINSDVFGSILFIE